MRFGATIWAVRKTFKEQLFRSLMIGLTTMACPIRLTFCERVVGSGDETIEFLCYASPGVFGPDYFHDIASVINAGGPPDMAKLKEVILSHGLVPMVG